MLLSEFKILFVWVEAGWGGGREGRIQVTGQLLFKTYTAILFPCL